MSIYDFVVKAQDGSDVALADYKGKVLMIVNTATECGFTPHYEDLQEIYDEFRRKGLEILDFPCNQFGAQAPGSNEEIHTFCTGRYGITFPQFDKVEVKGENAVPLFRWLEENSSFDGFGISPMGMMMTQILKKTDSNFAADSSIKWNFTKFIIDRNGNIAARFEPTASMKKVRDKVAQLL